MSSFVLNKPFATCHARAAVSHAARLAVNYAVECGSVVTSNVRVCNSSASSDISSSSTDSSRRSSSTGGSRTGSSSSSNRHSSNTASSRSNTSGNNSSSSNSSSGRKSGTGRGISSKNRRKSEVTSPRPTSPTSESSFPTQPPPASPAPPAFTLFSSPLPAVLPPPLALPHLLPRQQQRLALYLDLLLDWNQRMNLTAVTSRAEAEQRHIADSLSLIPAILALTAPSLPTAPIAASPTPTAPLPTEPLATAPIPTDSPSTVPLPTESPLDSPSATAPPAMPHGALRLVDVGTGAGLPGIVLAVAQPTWQVTLVESLNKRCDFLSHVVQRLGLNNVQVVCGRAEEVGRDPDHREAYDLAVARAVAEMRVLNELCLPLVRVGGAFIAAKGPNPQDEVAAASNSASLLGAQLATTYEVASSNTNGQRTAVIYKKVDPTASKYPRRPGMPSKRPL